MTGGAIGVNDGTSDIFVWQLADAGAVGAPAADTINFFGTLAATSGGDILDLRDLITGAATTASALDNYLHFEKLGNDTILHISSSGTYGDNNNAGLNASLNAKDVQTITFINVDLVTGFANDQAIIADLLTKQKLITD